MPDVTPRLQVLRHRLRITHDDPLTRQLSIELTLHNDHNKAANEVVLTEDTYRPGLRVFDSDGSELALLPNTAIREILSKSNDPPDAALLESLNSRRAYVYWVVFPESRAIEPEGTRIIRMMWTESLQHKFPWALGVKTFFNIPSYKIDVTVPPESDQPHFVTVYPPAGHRLVVERHSAMVLSPTDARDLTEGDHYHIGAMGPILDISIPHVESREVHVETVYGVYPDRNESDLLSGVAIGLIVLAVGFLLSMALWVTVPGAFHAHKLIRSALATLQANATLIGTSLIILCAGFVGLVSGPVFLRAKWWAIICGGVAAVGILVATL